MKLPLTIVATMLAGCMAWSPSAPSALSAAPVANAADAPIHFDGAVLRPGTSRARVLAVLGSPNRTGTTAGGRILDDYAFNPDGIKLSTASNAPVPTGSHDTHPTGTATVYHVLYGADGTIQSVTVSPPAVAAGAGLGGKSAAPAPNR